VTARRSATGGDDLVDDGVSDGGVLTGAVERGTEVVDDDRCTALGQQQRV
jgi:hypothetical protein